MQAKSEVDKKNKLIAKYEAYYKELKKSVDKRELERKANNNSVVPTSGIIENSLKNTDKNGSKSIVVDENSNTNTTTSHSTNMHSNIPLLHLNTIPVNHTTNNTTLNNSNNNNSNNIPNIPNISNNLNLNNLNHLNNLSNINNLNNSGIRHKNPTTSTLEASLQRNAAMDRRR